MEQRRRSHCLDGPNDVDWVFRNGIESACEEAFYVDYIKDDNGYRWISPKDRYASQAWGANATTDLVLATERFGLFSLAGLPAIWAAWSDAAIENATHWVENAKRNRSAIIQLAEAGQLSEMAGPSDIALILERWIFPLGTLSLMKREVTKAELKQERTSANKAFFRGIVGDLE